MKKENIVRDVTKWIEENAKKDDIININISCDKPEEVDEERDVQEGFSLQGKIDG